MSYAEMIMKRVQQDIINETMSILVHNHIRNYMEDNKGKKITKRIAKAVKESLARSGYSTAIVVYSKDYGMYQLTVWGLEGMEIYNKKQHFLLSYANMERDTYDPEKFDKVHDICHGPAAQWRQSQRYKLLSNEKRVKQLANILSSYSLARAELKLSAEAEDIVSILHLQDFVEA